MINIIMKLNRVINEERRGSKTLNTNIRLYNLKTFQGLVFLSKLCIKFDDYCNLTK